MKVRLDFVTNSSSSSFIIAKLPDKETTLENVYQKIRTFYNDFFTNLNKAKKYVEETNLFTYLPERSSFLPKGNLQFSDEEIVKVNKHIFDEFGIELHEIYDRSDNWLKDCISYKEYEKYWTGKEINRPFLLFDYSQKDFKYRPFGEHQALNIILPCFKEIKTGKNPTCIDCKHKYCELKENELEKIKELSQKDLKHSEQNVLLYFGKICISCDYTDIPEYVISKIKGISNYYFEHIG